MDKAQLKSFVRNKLTKSEIVLFGAGIVAERFYEKYHNVFNIVYVVSNLKKEWGPKKFMGEIDVVRYDKDIIGENQYLVVCGPIAFREIELQLIEDGREMYKDYIESEIAELLYSEKKIALFYGQCILRDIHTCLLNYEPFTNEYESVFTQIVMGQLKMLNRVLMYVKDICDLYVYTPKVLDRDSVYAISREELPKDCKVVSISNLVVPIYWPEINTKMGEFNPYYLYPYGTVRDTVYGHTLYRHEDLNINKMVAEGIDKKEILKILSDEDFYNRKQVDRSVNLCMKLISVAENSVDVKIHDFLNDNYRKIWLYQNFLHPQKIVIMEYIRRFLEKISVDTSGLEELSDQIPTHTHHGGDVPIYPSVIKHLELDFIPDDFKYEVMVGNGIAEMTFEEYMEHYIDYTECAFRINNLI